MGKILVVAKITWEENVRNKIFYLLFFLAIILIVGTRFINIFGFGAQSRLIREFSLTGIGFFGLIFTFALFLFSLPGEISRKTIYPVLAKPITRGQYLWGKFLGNMALVFIYLAVLAILLYLILYGETGFWMNDVLAAVWLNFLECSILGAILLLFSIFLSYPLNLSLTLLLYIIGNVSATYQRMILSAQSNPVSRIIVDVLKPILPQFDLFHIKNAVIQDYIINPAYVPLTTLYGILYIAIIMVLASLAFRRKEL
ncbi:MAG: ABC transporter permease subunit [Candidatus Eremiobacteraeota bacterium]|nr:ABC transporter permease subunit [Candidatus Eremiobacteraeota bacterium]